MAVSIADLIAKKEDIQAKKKNLYTLETSIGDIVFRVPSLDIVSDSWAMTRTVEGNQLLILECAVSPNLKDRELQQEFGCSEPIDIVSALFQSGEITRIAACLLNLAGFNENIKYKLHREVKNS